jgi:hypothetical protein
MNAGKWAIIGMLGVSLALAGFAVWFRQQAGRRCLEYWGVADAERIQHAARVELLQLTPAESGAWRLPDGSAAKTAGRQDVSQAAGLSHIRSALLEDRGFVWTPAAGGRECQPQWTCALRFADSGGETVVAFDLQCHQLRLLGSRPRPPLSYEPMAPFIRRFLTSQRPAAEPGQH